MSGLIDKSAKATIKTGSAVTSASGTLIQSTSKAGANLLVNRTGDIYDQHQNLTDGLGKSAVGNGTMLLRSGYRMGRSGARSFKNVAKRKRAREQFAKEEFIKENGINAWNGLSNHEKTQIIQKNEKWNGLQRRNKWEYYNSKNINQGFGMTATKQSVAKSKKEMMSNQTRKGLSMLTNKEDISSKSIGSTLRGTRLLWKNRKRLAQTSVKLVSMVKSVIASLIGFITSIPSLLTSVLAMGIPALLVIALLIIVACFFGEDLEFSGRVSLMSENEVRLENAYQTSINPEEVLAITYVLGWTTPDVEQYEMLMSIVFDGKRGENVPFEKMMDNVFKKYNPAKHLNPNSPLDNSSTSWVYWTSEWNRTLTFPLKKTEWVELYPKYKNASITEKGTMGSDEYIETMKADCRKALEVNGYNNLGSFLTIDNPPDVFTSYILPVNSGAKVSSPTGYRSIILNGKIDNSFHYGTDIAVAGGTPVIAPADMTVVYADGSETTEGTPVGLWGAGNVVILKKEVYDRKGKQCYLYVALFHLQNKSVTVKAGQKVTSGTEVGKVGSTGTSTGNHLHLQTWISTNNYTKKSLKWVDVYPKTFNDETKGRTYSVDDDDYEAIYIEGLLFYDINYRNSLYR